MFVAYATLTLASESKIYRTLDSQGRVSYSDHAPEDADEIEVKETITYTPTAVYQPAPLKQRDVVKVQGYQSLTITNPGNDETIRSNPGDLLIVFTVVPALQPNHSIQLLIDGDVFKTTKATTPMKLNNLDRGQHQFQLQIVEDNSSKVLHSSPGVSATLLRHSILHSRFRKP